MVENCRGGDSGRRWVLPLGMKLLPLWETEHREPSHSFSHCACFVFYGGHFEFLIRERSASARSGTELTEFARSLLISVSDQILRELASPGLLKFGFQTSHSDLAHVLKIQNGLHKTQNKRDKLKGGLIFHSYSKRMWNLWKPENSTLLR